MRRVRRLLGAVVTAGVLGGGLAACGGTPAAVTYTPAAYGVPGHCYYVMDPGEAQALLASGLCPAGWVPTLAPSSWVDEYWDYYDSPVYYNAYVPVSRRAVYVSVEHTYYVQHTTEIRQAETHATYKGSNGATVTGSKAVQQKFGTGATPKAATPAGGGARSPGAVTAAPAKTANGSTPKTAPRSLGNARSGTGSKTSKGR